MPKNLSKRSTQRGSFIPEKPNWEPLERAVVQWLAGQFMAMHEVELKNRAHVCCYKHIDTRGSLHLDPDLNAFLYSFD